MHEVPVSVQIIQRIAALDGVDPTDIEPPLYDAIDPEALDSLFRDADEETNVAVEFDYAGYTVAVDGVADVRVTAREPDIKSQITNVDGSIGN